MSGISYSEIPADMTTDAYLASVFATPQLEKRFEPHLQVPDLEFDHRAIADELAVFFSRYALGPWRSFDPSSCSVMGASLYYNPNMPEEEWSFGSFGHPRYREFQDYYRAPEQDFENMLKGSYHDGYAFRVRHWGVDAVCPTLAALLDRFTVPVVRVTARHINTLGRDATITGGFHRDEPPEEMLRINLAIVNDGDHALQYRERGIAIKSPSGSHAVVCADHDHRVLIPRPTVRSRLHVVIGLIPWFDYDKESDSWSPNEHHGKTHPYDMVKQGLIFK